MPTDSGYTNQKKLGLSQFETVHPLGSDAYGKKIQTIANFTKDSSSVSEIYEVDGKDGKVEFWNIEVIGHSGLVGEILRITAGTLLGFDFTIVGVPDGNNVLVHPISFQMPDIGDTVDIMGFVGLKLSPSGEISASTSFVLDSGTQSIVEDTSDPSNNKALPAHMFVTIDGVQYPVSKDTGTPANTVSIPVEITGAAGPINITAGDLNVQLSDQGANADVTRIGNGTNKWGINASTEGLVHDADVLAQSVLLVAKDFATSAKQDALLAELQLKADLTETQPVSLASIPLATGAATEAKQDTLIAKDFATSAKQDTNTAAINLLAKLTDTQPVSAASLPLPTGAATEAKQDAAAVLTGAVTETAPATDTASSGLNGRLQRIAQRITSLIALLPASLGQKASAASLAAVLSTEQEAILTAIKVAAETQAAKGVLVGSYQEIVNLTNVVQTFIAPAGAKWCKVQADDTNTANIRVKIGAAATISSGMQFQGGRSEDYQIAGNISVICETAATNQKIYVQFGV